MKRITGYALVILIAAGCTSSIPDPGSGTAKAPAQVGANQPGSVFTAAGQAPLLAETAELERAISESLSVPAPVPAAPVAETGKKEPAAVPVPKPEPRSKASKAAKVPSVSVQKSQAQAMKKLTIAELRAKYPEVFKLSGSAKEKNIALTFDDGPDERFTPQVLDVLKAYGVKATFFLLGKKAEAHPAIVKRIVREGHAIGNHSYRHPLFTKITVDQFADEVGRTEEVLNRIIGYRPKLLRPPYGEIGEGQLQWASAGGYVVVNWNVDSLDWKSLGEKQVSGNILNHTKAGAIVLQHSAGGDSQDLSGTVKALPAIIMKLREQGYGLVTVPELLHLPKNK
ncbi:polysaccharide deacetylase family protein [Paenibacillus ginsengarvi]|uniref:Polysaccharide deacetylase family protein n=1 Tax=Paenibacillus ginsengarvi TaxID=400777 RepID=A0A3B0AVN7_9BACL|nr:polysaccharide deacetylase family protein [Paenibacillus ginsengarvi]RKN64321.1 polysaccharide deacetylase family protein [Paenibacillus ginsengarvi]